MRIPIEHHDDRDYPDDNEDHDEHQDHNDHDEHDEHDQHDQHNDHDELIARHNSQQLKPGAGCCIDLSFRCFPDMNSELN